MEYRGEIWKWEAVEAFKNTDFPMGINLTTVNLGPKPTLKYFDSLGREELSGIFYSCWQTDDYPDYEKPDCGTLHAYGEKDGKYYHGEVPFQPVTVEETDGIWESNNATFNLDAFDDKELEEELGPDGNAEVDRLFDRLNGWSESDILYSKIRSAKEMADYLKDVGDLMRICPYYFAGAFADWTADDVRLLHVFMEDDGSYTMELAAV